VVPRDDERVAREERPVIEERDAVRVVEDDVGRLRPGDDATEGAVRVGAAHPPSGDS
jgi:hypothetical protein